MRRDVEVAGNTGHPRAPIAALPKAQNPDSSAWWALDASGFVDEAQGGKEHDKEIVQVAAAGGGDARALDFGGSSVTDAETFRLRSSHAGRGKVEPARPRAGMKGEQPPDEGGGSL